MTMARKLVVLTGPTAGGKTSAALFFAQRFDAEIVSADSMQVYRRMDIGTAKPTPEERAQVRHHVIDVAEPMEAFDAARYVKHADSAIEEIHGRGKRVLVVGGTGLYLRALLHGLHEAPPPVAEARAALLEEAAKLGFPALHARLAEIDPETAQRLHPNDGMRISRALEVYQVTGVPMSRWQLEHGFALWRYEALILAFDIDKDLLRRRIFDRVDRMMEQGLLAEVRALLDSGVPQDCKAMGSLGYKQLAAHLRSELPLDLAIEQIKLETRRYAKRQLTWLRREQGVQWVAPSLSDLEQRVATAFGA
ncbi:MAG: tRNA (adenosine(37)-N6)-dimethylallyltransferase MiaA [Myxococcota bacterium]|jgi:tRNA dimethylallyltransferase|nr:tRNA (adenosine(37)-N6)-dimethylallyltransferase MiaA [Myxococcota bacterium]